MSDLLKLLELIERMKEVDSYKDYQKFLANFESVRSIDLPSNFKEVEEWGHDYLRHVWVCIYERVILTYVEGDVTLQIYGNDVEFFHAIHNCVNFYEKGIR